MPKQIERICKNCRLFNPQKSECSVIIFVAGEKMRIPVDAADPCFFEENYFDPNENFAEHIKETGKKSFYIFKLDQVDHR